MPTPIDPATDAWARDAVQRMLARVRKALLLEYLQRARDLR